MTCNNILTRHSQQLDMFKELMWNHPNDCIKYKKIVEKERIFKFLVGLKKNLDEVWERILEFKPLSSIWEVFFEVRRKESRQKIMMGNQSTSATPETLALVSWGVNPSSNDNRTRKGRPWCDHCRNQDTLGIHAGRFMRNLLTRNHLDNLQNRIVVAFWPLGMSIRTLKWPSSVKNKWASFKSFSDNHNPVLCHPCLELVSYVHYTCSQTFMRRSISHYCLSHQQNAI